MSDLYAPQVDYNLGEETVSPNDSLKAHIIDFIQSIVVIGAIFALIYLFIAQPHKVSGKSMDPTFHNGDYILTDKITYRFQNPQRGDVIVLKNPQDENQDFIKRVIAIPGETVSISGGRVLINSNILKEIYLGPEVITSAGNFLHEGEIVKVGQNQYFVLGDNRGGSSDSRAWGPITKEKIKGRVIFRYFPPDVIGIIPTAGRI